MKITELKIKSFGCFHQKEITFGDGLNVVYGPNESGKTTMHTFIKSMFFGIRRLRGRAARTDSYSRYEPWENPGHYAGSIRFSCGGRVFRLARSFQKEQANAFLICETDGEKLSIGDGDLKMLLGGISESIYDNTVSIGQLRSLAGQELAMELKNYMANYQESGDGALNLEKTFAALKKEKKELQDKLAFRERAREQQGQKLQDEISYQEGELDKLQKNLQDNIKEIQARKAAGGGEYPVAGLSAFWNLAMLFIAFAAGTGIALLDGWLRILPILLGVSAEMVLLYIRTRKMKDIRRVRRREYQKKEELAKDLDRLGFLKEHLEQEIEEKTILLQNFSGDYEEYVRESPAYDGIPKKIEALDLAIASIDRISRQMQGRIGKRLRTRTSEIFREITGGKYQQTSLDESLKMTVDTGENYVPIEQLSRGTMEQLYFALRMAASEILCKEEPLPVILDDVFAMYDNGRLAQTLTWLAKSGKQVILCTCHTRESEILRQMQLPYTEILL